MVARCPACASRASRVTASVQARGATSAPSSSAPAGPAGQQHPLAARPRLLHRPGVMLRILGDPLSDTGIEPGFPVPTPRTQTAQAA